MKRETAEKAKKILKEIDLAKIESEYATSDDYSYYQTRWLDRIRELEEELENLKDE